MFKPKHFSKTLDGFAKEVLPPDIYNERGVRGLELMSEPILQFIDDYRGDIKVALTVNNWSWGGKFTQSGLRNDSGTGAKYSQHRYGNAVDFRSIHKTGHELRKHFIENKDKYPQISFVEVGPIETTVDGEKVWVDMSWFHGDCRTRIDWEGVRYWSPKHGFVTEEFVLEHKL